MAEENVYPTFDVAVRVGPPRVHHFVHYTVTAPSGEIAKSVVLKHLGLGVSPEALALVQVEEPPAAGSEGLGELSNRISALLADFEKLNRVGLALQPNLHLELVRSSLETAATHAALASVQQAEALAAQRQQGTK